MCRVYISRVGSELEVEIQKALDWIEAAAIIKPGSRVFIKPNLTDVTHKPGVTTSPLFLETLVKVIKQLSGDITIVETDGGYHAWKAEQAFQNHNLYRLKEEYDINLLNLYESPVGRVCFDANSREYSVPLPKVLTEDADVFISVPVLKVHSMTGFTFGLKNQ